MTPEEIAIRAIPHKASDCSLIKAQKEYTRQQLIKWIYDYARSCQTPTEIQRTDSQGSEKAQGSD
jgi:hypothetical protein